MEDVGAADHRGHQRPEDHRAERDVDEKIAGARTGLHAAAERPEAEDVDPGRGEQPPDAEARLPRAHAAAEPPRPSPNIGTAQTFPTLAPARPRRPLTARASPP